MTWQLTSIKRIAVLLLVAGMLIFSTNASAMFKVCLFSPVRGKVVLKGQPVVGAVIERIYDWHWGNKKGRDETMTDQNGEFNLSAIYGTMILGKVAPHEPVIMQRLVIKVSERSYNAWVTRKANYDEFGELEASEISGGLQGHPISLLCDLDAPVTNHGGVFGYGGIAELQK